MMQVNLISDTVTKPSAGMQQAMWDAPVGDDVFKEDPTVNTLEEHLAQMFGKEAALFFPSGTMANQTAIKIHTQPGDQLICDATAHVYNYEGGGVSFNSGVSCKLIAGDQGRISATQVAQAINPPDFYHSPRTRLVCLENTTNKGGGACYSWETIEQIASVCRANDLKLHLDGARLWNALVDTPKQTTAFGQVFDTLSVCFSKGLGCPVGSALVGSKETIQFALKIRKILGGGMRQAGYLAAAALFALEHQWMDLKQDHQRAQEIGKLLSQSHGIAQVLPVHTNIVIFKLQKNLKTQTFINQMKSLGIQLIAMDAQTLRMVTHRDYTAEQHAYVLEVLKTHDFSRGN